MSNPEDGRSTEQKVAIIRQIIPELFQQPNFLSKFILKGKKIIISPNTQNLSFTVSESDSPISKKCEFSYDGKLSLNEGTDQESNIQPKWLFSAKFKSGSALINEKTEFEITFIGDRDKDSNQHSPTDQIFIHDNQETQSTLIDFRNKKIGISDKGKRGAMVIYRYGVNNQFFFENIKNNAVMKRFEYNEVSKLIALILKNNKEIILPISINYDPSEKIKFLSDKMSESQISIKSPNGNIISETDIVQKKLDKVVYVDGKKMILSGEDSNPTIKYGDLSLTFDQLRLIYYLFGRKTLTLNIPKVIPGVQPRKIKDILNDIIKNNHTVLLANPYSPDRIIIIFNEAARLGLISSKFIETFKTFVSSSI